MSPDTDMLAKALDLAVGSHSPDMPVEKYRSAARRIASKTPRKHYSAYYLRNIMRGKQPMTESVYSHCRQYVHAKMTEAPIDPSKDGQVNIADTVKFVPGSVVLMDSVLCPCGIWFIPKVPNQKYHTPACSKLKGSK